VNAKLNEEDDSSNVLLLSNLPLEHNLGETREKDEKEERPAESEDGPGNEITILQKLKTVLGIQRDRSNYIKNDDGRYSKGKTKRN
jgi:hypothetical protein